MKAGAAPLLIERLSKRFGDIEAVADVDLRIRQGEVFALLGPNGAGKTTIINCVAGLSRPTSGSIQVFGHDTVRDFRVTRRLLGLVPQEIVFDPFFTPRESLRIQMGLMGVKPDLGRVDELLRMFALWSRRDSATRSLSGGMKRRLLVAKALVHRPRLLCLDEPTAGVDVELRKDLWEVVRRLAAEGTTVILTTHYIEEAEAMADRVGIINHGRLVLVEERDSLLSRNRRGQVRAVLPVALSAPPAHLPPGTRLESENVIVAPWATARDIEEILRVVRQLGEPEEISIQQTRLEDIYVDLLKAAPDSLGRHREGESE